MLTLSSFSSARLECGYQSFRNVHSKWINPEISECFVDACLFSVPNRMCMI
uniref:SJCHGC02623 protein n=1 Tax=Schistosoma japonicum TaxID=6182 RepID=Q5BT67_SCHJA|nr:SJCHGC02623 protein [Schistosoma japonicum]